MTDTRTTIQQRLAAYRGASLTFLAHRRFALGALVVGKALDAISTVVVLTLVENAYEANPLVRSAIHEFGLIEGVLLTAIPAIGGVMLLAETGTGIARSVPDAWVPARYPALVRYGAYGFGALWYAWLGVHNFAILFGIQL